MKGASYEPLRPEGALRFRDAIVNACRLAARDGHNICDGCSGVSQREATEAIGDLCAIAGVVFVEAMVFAGLRASGLRNIGKPFDCPVVPDRNAILIIPDVDIGDGISVGIPEMANWTLTATLLSGYKNAILPFMLFSPITVTDGEFPLKVSRLPTMSFGSICDEPASIIMSLCQDVFLCGDPSVEREMRADRLLIVRRRPTGPIQ